MVTTIAPTWVNLSSCRRIQICVIEVPYTISNLVNATGGTVQPASQDPHHALRFRMDIDGSYMMWCCSDTYPPRRARVIASDIKCESGVLVHIVDKIIYV